jgi:hypothetical protein
MTRLAIAVAAMLSAACVPEDGPLMSPGEDCLECHGGGREGGGDDGDGALHVWERSSLDDDGPRWSAAGTVFRSRTSGTGDGVRGARVHLTDANGRELTLHSNQAGNFYTAERLRFPLRASIEVGGVTKEMEPFVEYGGCNDCHALPPQDDAPGRLAVE